MFPPVKFVLDKFRHKLPKDELKRLGKEIATKLVSSDYKNNRVGDPAAPLTEKQERKIKVFVRDFLNRAVQKFGSQPGSKAVEDEDRTAPGSQDGKPDTTPSDVEDDVSEGRKRKRDEESEDITSAAPSDGPDAKRLKEEETETGEPGKPSPPPPPPPPTEETEEQKALKEQEEALMRENEEAQRLEDEAEAKKEMDMTEKVPNEDTPPLEEHGQNRKQEVLSH